MAYAKTLIGDGFYTVTPQHNSLFPYVVSWLMKLGLSEMWIKFALVVIPSILLVWLSYKIAMLFYDDKWLATIVLWSNGCVLANII